jgi:crotonobetainyl-CoA:carnitine CoA-transferase CaiB-like acyl-CoA transferase
VTVRGLHDRAAIAKVTGARPLEDWLAERSPHEAMEALQAAGVAAGAMLRVSELPAFDYYAAREAFREVRHPHIEEPLIVEAGLIGLGAEEIGRLIASGALEQLERPS